jgi:hypothetical protein
MGKITKRQLFISLGVLVILGLIVGGYFLWLDGAPMRQAEEQRRQNQISTQVFQIAQSGDSAQCGSINYVASDGTDYHAVCVNNAILEKIKSTGDIGLCAGIEKNLISGCRQSAVNFLVQNNKDSSVCDKLSQSGDVSDCKISFVFKDALSSLDTGKCSSLPAKNLQDFCRDSVLTASIGASKSVSCSTFNSQSLKSDCENFKKLMLGSKDSCNLIVNPSIRASCMTNK